MTGDREAAFTLVFETNVKAVLAYALRRTSQAADAADVVAETFLVAWRRFEDLPERDEDRRAWLFGTARRVMANQRRSSRRRDALGARLRDQLESAVADHADDVVTSTAITAEVREAMHGLSRQDREVLCLTAWEGLAPNEIAQVLSIPAATVRTRLHRARAHLSDALRHSERSPEPGHVLGDGTPAVATETER